MRKSVLVLGGGVAGMSAAHELIERGFDVVVLEKKKELPGGKARSIPIADTASGGRKLLPGEHGFRFFPGFYKHITDTMKRIPFAQNKNRVYDNLVESPNIMLARMGFIPIVIPGHLPKSLSEVRSIIENLFRRDSGLQKGESKLIALKIWQLMTSCKERRDEEYEQRSWWCFTEAESHSESYRTLFVDGLTRTLVAAKAETCNTRTNGNVLLQLLFHFGNKEVPNDRILDGPTNEVWLSPWLTYLHSSGVQYNFNCQVVSLETDGKQITGVSAILNERNERKIFSADYYVCALPVERAAKLFNSDILRMDPQLANVILLSKDVAWMNGIQFYLEFDVEINHGHIILADTPWALTAISQAQFWKTIDLEKDYGKGDVRGIISVDVSDWDKEGIIDWPEKNKEGTTVKKPAKECTKKEVIKEVWEQMKRTLNTDDNIVLKDDNFKMAFVDDSIIFKEDFLSFFSPSKNPEMNKISKYGSNKVNENDEPLLVNKINTWHLRNGSKTKIPNLYLASDYVKTNTDLATMEGANEAARSAVNEILRDAGSDQLPCKIWDLYEPNALTFHKWLDKRRYKKGLPWKYYNPLLVIIFWLLRKVKFI
jgi:uncharacterized protein with NAD-binding domain and iron-sulfur cluster